MTIYCGGRCEYGHGCCSGGLLYAATEWLKMEPRPGEEEVREHDFVCEVAQLVRDRDHLRRVLRHIAKHCIQEPDIAQFAARALDGSADVEEEEEP